jgi:hypothetical protein
MLFVLSETIPNLMNDRIPKISDAVVDKLAS